MIIGSKFIFVKRLSLSGRENVHHLTITGTSIIGTLFDAILRGDNIICTIVLAIDNIKTSNGWIR